MSFVLDHLFVFTRPGAPEAAGLGLAESHRRDHPGQGTANRCHGFDNAYLELLWVVDEAELRSPEVAPTKLAERSTWRETGTCPFGIGLRGGAPFDSWRYVAPCFPPGFHVEVARSSDDPDQPFIFAVPGGRPPEKGQVALREIVGLDLTLPPGVEARPALALLAAEGVVVLGQGERWRLDVVVSTSAGGPRRLSLPDFTWI